jgi:hypothetical protein
MSVDKAFREMIRSEVESQLRPLREAIGKLEQQTGSLDGLEGLLAQLAPFAALFKAAPATRTKARRAARPEGTRGCAIAGCGRTARTKGYCSAHYQKLRMLARSGRRPAEWIDFAIPDSVPDQVLPRGAAAARASPGLKKR